MHGCTLHVGISNKAAGRLAGPGGPARIYIFIHVSIHTVHWHVKYHGYDMYMVVTCTCNTCGDRGRTATVAGLPALCNLTPPGPGTASLQYWWRPGRWTRSVSHYGSCMNLPADGLTQLVVQILPPVYRPGITTNGWLERPGTTRHVKSCKQL